MKGLGYQIYCDRRRECAYPQTKLGAREQNCPLGLPASKVHQQKSSWWLDLSVKRMCILVKRDPIEWMGGGERETFWWKFAKISGLSDGPRKTPGSGMGI